MKVAVPTVPPQDTALLALTSSALVIIVLVLLALSIIYCKRFWKSQCQRGESMPAALLPLLPLPFTHARSPSLLCKGPLLCFACSDTRSLPPQSHREEWDTAVSLSQLQSPLRGVSGAG